MVPDDRKYTQEHEWVQVDGDMGTIGLTDFAASELGGGKIQTLTGALDKFIDMFFFEDQRR